MSSHTELLLLLFPIYISPLKFRLLFTFNNFTCVYRREHFLKKKQKKTPVMGLQFKICTNKVKIDKKTLSARERRLEKRC